MSYTRRSFISGGSAVSIGMLSGCRCPFGGSDGSYSVAILGDTHYDAENAGRFHADFLRKVDRKKCPWPFREFSRNGYIWAKDGPGRKILAASARCVTPDTRFVLQLGDLVQGDCDSAALHTAMLDEMSGMLRANYGPEMPIVGVCGNHDVRQGANPFDVKGAYRRFAEEWRARDFYGPRGEKPVPGTSFAFRQGPDAFVAIDFNAPDLALLERLLAATEGARYLFVFLHSPIIPMSSWRTRFFYFGEKRQDAERRAARAMLARRNAIVLAGHEHKMERRVWKGDGGSITEMVFNTIYFDGDVTKPNPAVPDVFASKPADFMAGFASCDADKRKDLEPLYAEYAPGLVENYAANAVGHYRLNVSDAVVTVDYFGRDAVIPTCRYSLANRA